MKMLKDHKELLYALLCYVAAVILAVRLVAVIAR